MFTASYYSALNHASEVAPSLDNPTKFIMWAEDITSLLSYIYNVDYDEVTADLYEKVKEFQEYEDEAD